MNAKWVALWCLAALVLSTGSLKADNLAFAVSSFNEFGTVDLNTGAFTLTGSTPVALSGLGGGGRFVRPSRATYQNAVALCRSLTPGAPGQGRANA